MGFMDKAKKMAEQAQAKLDEAQQSFNERQGHGVAGTAGGPASDRPPVEYDKHGRPVPAAAQPQVEPPEASRTPPHGDPLAAGAPAAEPAATPPETPAGTPAEAPKPKAPPAGGTGLTSGDPLAG
jgi:hypothetical protein